MKWINVKEKHFAKIWQTEIEAGTVDHWESDFIDEPFMVAIKTNNGWCIQQVVLVDSIGLQCYTDEDGATYFGWDITDVSHWMKLENPEEVKEANDE